LETQTCKSCERQFSGNYCNNCGEKVIDQDDRKLKHYLGEFINALTFADSKFWRTIRSILIHPGRFSKHFIEGKRKAYMKPISVFFLANLLYFLFPLFNTFNTPLQTQINADSFIHSTLAEEMVLREIANRDVSIDDYTLLYNAKTLELSKLLLILIAIGMSCFFMVIHMPKKRLFVDHLTINLELMTFVLLFAVQVQGLFLLVLRKYIPRLGNELVSEFMISGIVILLLFYFMYRAERTFYQFERWRSILNALLSIVCFVIILYVYRAILFFITFWSI
jgi:hypothetical protein